MLHIILQILAVIGIVILCILGLFLVLLLLVLFVPIRYRVKGFKDSEDYDLRVKVSYLLHILTLRYELPKPGELVVKLFGIRIFPKNKVEKNTAEAQTVKTEAENENSDNTETKTETETEAKAKTEAEDEPDIVEQIAEGREDFPNSEAQNRDGFAEQTQANAGEIFTEQTDTEDEPKLSFLRHPILWIRKRIEKFVYTIRSICDKIKNITEMVTYYKEVVTAKENTAFYKRTKKQVFQLLKSIRPRKLRADLRIGTGSPDTTGYLCAVYGMLLPLLGKHVNITADFEEAVLEGEFYAKGRITVFTVLYHAVRVAFDKQLKILIKELKREESHNGRKSV